jgi:hypothetical protein
MAGDQPAVRTWVVAAAVAAIAVVAFSPSLAGGWIWDDRPLIADNPYLHSFRFLPRWFATDFWNVSEQVVQFASRIIYWRPAISASYALDWQLGGGSPAVFHVMNLAYHGVVAVLAFAALRRWIGGSIVAAAAAAMVFAVHPAKTESVAWISGRTDILCVIGILVACAGMARRLRGERRSGLALEVAGTIAAYLSKEQAVVLPALAVIEAWVAAGRGPLERASLRPFLRAALPQLAIAIAYLVARAIWLPITSSQAEHATLPLGDHALVVLETFGRLFEVTFAPHSLSVQQGTVVLEAGSMVHSLPYVIVGALGLAALVTAAVLARRRWPAATIGIGFYLATLLPTANLKFSEMIPLVSERFLYLPVLGLALVVGSALAAADRTWQRRGLALAGACAVALGALAADHAADFRDEKAFWARELRLHPSSRDALKFAYTNAAAEKHYDAALAYLLQLQQVAQHVPMHGGDVLIATEVASILSHLVPDRDPQSLRALDRFCAELLAHDQPVATLDVRGVALAIPTTKSTYAANLHLFETRLLVLRAELASRLGDDAHAVELVAAARRVCATCVEVVVVGALSAARAGRYPEARALLDDAAGKVVDVALADTRKRLDRAEQAQEAALAATGPTQLQARATELSALGLWGRAYDVLAPYQAEIAQAPGMVLGFAELAFRAGDPAAARQALAGRPAEEIDALLREWAERMGWPPP